MAPNGDIFISDGHGVNDRVVKFSNDGRLSRAGDAMEQARVNSISPTTSRSVVPRAMFSSPTAATTGSGFDQEGNFITAWKQFGRPSALFVSRDDTLYVSDSQSNSTRNPGYLRASRLGAPKTARSRPSSPIRTWPRRRQPVFPGRQALSRTPRVPFTRPMSVRTG